MRAFVFTDESLARHAGQFVWLDIDTEKPRNAAFRKQYPVPALPSYFVIDPNTEHAALRWVGGATVGQLDRFLDEGALALKGSGDAGGPEARDANAALAEADRLYGDGKDAEAAVAYLRALQSAPEGWPRFGRSVEALMFALSRAEDWRTTDSAATVLYPKLRGTNSAASVAASGLSAATSLPDSVPDRAARAARHEANLREALADPKVAYSGDDRSGYLITLMDAHTALHDSVGAHQITEEWSATLDAIAAKTKTPAERVVYDSHRLSAYLELGQPEKAVPMLLQSQKDFPEDYNPPARLATAYLAMKRYDDAIASADRAIKLGYGPRSLRFFQTKSDAWVGKGDTGKARAALDDAIAYAKALPEPQRSASTITNLEKKRDALAATASTGR
jgi:tetratricopeptide (TPR) repeat protein